MLCLRQVSILKRFETIILRHQPTFKLAAARRRAGRVPVLYAPRRSTHRRKRGKGGGGGGRWVVVGGGRNHLVSTAQCCCTTVRHI